MTAVYEAPLGPATGVINGLLIAIPMWIVIVWTAWKVVRG